jgi:hypothetical protein
VGERLNLVHRHFVALDIGDDHSEGARDTEFELFDGEVVGAKVRAVAIKELDLEEGKSEETTESVVDLAFYKRSLGMRSDADISDLELVTDIKEFLLTDGVLEGVSAGPPEIGRQGRMTADKEEGE